MSQQTLDSNVTPEGSPAEPNAPRQGTPARRRRRAAERKPSAAQTTQTAQATQQVDQQEQAATQASAPEATVPAAGVPASEQQPAASGEAVETEESRPAGRGTRSRRRGSGRKAEVQLVKPAGAAQPATELETGGAAIGELSALAAGAPEADPAAGEAAAQVRVVPVVTQPPAESAIQAEPATPLTAEPAEIAAAETQPAPPRKYRFERRTSVAAAQAGRPERLSTAASAQPAATVEAVEAPAPGPLASGVAEEVSAPAAFEAPEPKEARESGAMDDILAALGLRDVTPREGSAATHIAEPHAAEDEMETEEASEAEQEAQGTGEAEGQGATRRRRRRRRGSGPHGKGGAEDETEETTVTPFWPEPSLGEPASRTHDVTAPTAPYAAESEPAVRNGYDAYSQPVYAEEEQQPYSPYGRQARTDRGQPWDITTGTQQVRQPESPFGAPEPSYARGFGPQPRGVAGPVRENTYTRSTRTERGTDVPPISSNQLATMVTHAIQQQTDRLLAELRHQSNPPSMTVMFPPFPSTERVGVFVDVANLHYSSRSMRISLDFGRLLDFLRGNRRLVRAQAYAPTDPDPRADQAFLSAVKGLGYRITTKNYKTFASGAKKADMDLDLCMDIVRLVDAGSLDTVVLVSGDSDFLPLLEYCSDHGVRVEVAAFEDAAAAILRQSCDLFINLSMVEDIRA